ncbi:3'(2'),5'-bisphosphate nucleotidase CysQ [Dietzia sp. B32]|uniref:3'(2'),5'-bisphosphate nucleotidase CysQ n=1 Tax=Dietzia sp. B32 TaxID=2915130 RepID=UPI0021ADF8AB|nr:3'(2'),5'-bisphosphate nucleotidase CysQ [Dietzia sp. B32]UVE96109.1 3'(2'),5'-bisphosphate nucleotidase CysQ [Dietzia sp. B32]
MRDLDDHDLASHLAHGIGDIVRGTRAGGLLHGRSLARVANEVAQNWTDEVLAVHRPDDGTLSEGVADDRSRLSRSRVWIIDVIDGTKEFSTGRSDWSVHVALVVDGHPTVAAVGLPDAGRVFRSDQVDHVDGPHSGTMVISRNNPPAGIHEVADELGLHVRPMGSAGAKMLSVLLGDADVYLHAGGQNEWDQAAPVGVALAAGLHASRIDGSPLEFNKSDTYSPDILVCRPDLTEKVLTVTAGHPVWTA